MRRYTNLLGCVLKRAKIPYVHCFFSPYPSGITYKLGTRTSNVSTNFTHAHMGTLVSRFLRGVEGALVTCCDECSAVLFWLREEFNDRSVP